MMGQRRATKVCLVHPPTLTSADAYGLDVVPPLGLAYIAAALKAVGHEVSVVDGIGEALQRYGRVSESPRYLVHGLNPDDVIARIPADAEVVGISNMFSNQWLFVRDLVRGIKKAHPQKLLVIGGEHVTACPEYIIETCDAVDVCVLGEGEETIVDVIDAYLSRRSFGDVAGIVFRKDGVAVRTPPRGRIKDIDAIPEPAWDLVPIENYIENACTYGANLGRSMPILASRGCPFQCTFCSSPQMWTTRWTARKPEILLAEMQKYAARYAVTNFDFYDLTAIVSKEWIAQFCRLLIDRRVNFTWQLASGTRSEAIDEEVVDLLYASGCRVVIYAPESGSIEELKRIKKKVNPARMLRSIHAAHKAGIETKANMIFGMLGATWRDVLHSFAFIGRLAVAGVTDTAAYPYSPYPGSEDFQKLLTSGRVTLGDEYFQSLLLLSRNLHTRNTISYNERFTSRMLAFLCSCAFVWFYSLSYLMRPWRAPRMLYTYLIRREASSILTLAFWNLRRKRVALRLIERDHAGSVVLPPRVRIRNTGS